MIFIGNHIHDQLAITTVILTYICDVVFFNFMTKGIDHRIWEQAKLDNPDPEKMIPVPMVGFTELHNRLKHQEQQTQMHTLRLDVR